MCREAEEYAAALQAQQEAEAAGNGPGAAGAGDADDHDGGDVADGYDVDDDVIARR